VTQEYEDALREHEGTIDIPNDDLFKAAVDTMTELLLGREPIIIVGKIEGRWRVWKVPTVMIPLLYGVNEETGVKTDIAEFTKRAGQEKASVHEVAEWFLEAVRKTDDWGRDDKARRAAEQQIDPLVRRLRKRAK